MNIVKSIFRGTQKYTDSIKSVDEAIGNYTNSVIDLSTVLNLKLLEETKEIQSSIGDVSKQIGAMSISFEAHFQTLHNESQTNFGGINKIQEDMLGKFLYFAVCSQTFVANIYVIDKEARETEKRFQDWLSYSVKEVKKERRKNPQLQISSPPEWIFDLPAFHS